MRIEHRTGKCISPASYDRQNDKIIIWSACWRHLTDDEKRFVFLHELGHKLKGWSETKADEFALRNFAGSTNRSLKKTLNLFYRFGLLTPYRFNSLVKNIALIDLTKFNNPKAIKILKQTDMEALYNKPINEIEIPEGVSLEALTRDVFEQYVNDLGINYEALTPKEKEALINDFLSTPFGQSVVYSVAMTDLNDSENFALGALLGGAVDLVGGWLGKGVSKVVQGAKNIFGGNKNKSSDNKTMGGSNSSLIQEQQRQIQEQQQQIEALRTAMAESEKKSKTMLYVGGAFIVVLILALIFILINR